MCRQFKYLRTPQICADGYGPPDTGQNRPKSALGNLAIRVWGCLEALEQVPLRVPIRWNAAPDAPVRCEANGLFAFQNITDDVGSQERQFNDLLNAAFGCLLGVGDLVEGRARLDLFELSMGLGDVSDELVVLSRWHICKDELGLDTTFPELEVGCDVQSVFI